MNAIPYISKDHSLFTDLSLKHIIYFYLISHAQVKRGTLICDSTVVDVMDKFCRNYSDEDITEVFSELEKENLIVVNKDTIELGNTVEGRRQPQLFTGNTDSLEEEYNQICDHLGAFRKESVGAARARVSKLQNEFTDLREKPLEKWNIYNLLSLYETCYAAYFMEFHREFAKVDYRHMSNISKLYDIKTLFKMIVYYVFHTESYGQIASLSYFLHHKDEIYAKVKGLNKRGKSLRKIKIDDRF